MKSVLVDDESEVGSVPAVKLDGEPFGNDRAGQLGNGGGGVSCTRSTNGSLLLAPL